MAEPEDATDGEIAGEKETDTSKVSPELQEDYKRLRNLARGNGKMEMQLAQQGKQLDLADLVAAKLDLLLDRLMGPPEESRERLDLELELAVQIRTMLLEAFNIK